MDWIELLKLFGITTGPQIILIVIIGFWGKKIIEYFFTETIEVKKHELNQEYEKYKQHIEHENKKLQLNLDEDLENYKSKLELLKLEFHIRYSELYNKRSKVIVNLYKILSELNTSINEYTLPDHFVRGNAEKEEKDRHERVNSAIGNFRKYYLPNKLYFPHVITLKLDKLYEFTVNKTWNYSYTKSLTESKNLSSKELSKQENELNEINQIVLNETQKAMTELEKDFQKLLGIEPFQLTDKPNNNLR